MPAVISTGRAVGVARLGCHVGQTIGVSDTSPQPTPDPDERLRYLSLEWIDALSAAVGESELMAEIAEHHSVGVTQVVSDGPEGDVTYHLLVADGSAVFGAGPAAPEDVKMEQDWQTAVDVATGELNAQEAFINGHIRLFGDQQKLLESQPVFGALDTVFASVRDRTAYE